MKNMTYHVKKNCLLIAPIVLIESLVHEELRKISSIIPSVFLQTAVVKVEMSFTFPTVLVKLNNSEL